MSIDVKELREYPNSILSILFTCTIEESILIGERKVLQPKNHKQKLRKQNVIIFVIGIHIRRKRKLKLKRKSDKVLGFDFSHLCLECGMTTKNPKFCSNSCSSKYKNRLNNNLRFSARTKRHFIINTKVIEFVDGLLLGDADVERGSSWATRLRQRFALKYSEWALLLQEKFKKLGIISTLSYGSNFDKRTNKTYYWVALQTRSYPEFKIFRNRWYPNGIKEVPKDLIICKTLIENFFLSDGSARSTTENGAALKLATHAFSKESVNFLIEKMEDFGFNFHIGSENTLHLYSKSDVVRFQKLISFPKCFQYKKVI